MPKIDDYKDRMTSPVGWIVVDDKKSKKKETKKVTRKKKKGVK